ncbi:MAG: GNAT family N-acetyltransferase [Paludibacteraceae bacterium]
MYETYRQIDKFEPFLFIAIEDEVIVGCLLAIVQKEFNGLLGRFTQRSIIMGGPIADTPEVADELLKKYDNAVSNKAIYSELRNLFDMSQFSEIFSKNGYIYESHLDIHIDLLKKAEEITRSVSKNKRGNVSKSTNKGTLFVEINDDENYLKCVKLIQQTYKRIALPCPGIGFFNVFKETLKNKGILKVFVAKNNGLIVGARIELCYKGVIYDWFAGSDDNAKNLYPNDFLPYNILMWGNENNYESFDFGGAGKPDIPYGVREHKLKFGGELVEFGRYKKIHQPIMMYIGTIGLKVYKMIKKMKKWF